MAGDTIKLYLTVDNKGAIVALRRVGDESAATSRKIQAHNAETASSFKKTHDHIGRTHERISLLAGSVGLGGLAFGLADVVKKGMAWQQQQGVLQTALRNTHAGGARTLDMLSRAAEMGSTKGGFTAPDELQALAQFTTLTKNANQALHLNSLAMNLARGTTLGYTGAQRVIGQALTGNVGRLQRYLGIIQPVKTNVQALTAAHKLNVFQLEAQAKAMGKAGPLWLKQQELLHGIAPLQLQHAQLLDKQATAQKALSLVQDHYGGMMAKFSHNNAGQMSNLRNSIDVLAASMGAALLPALKIVVGGLITFAQWGQKHKTLLLALIGTVAAVTVAYGAVTVATALWGAALLASGPIMVALGPIIAGVRTAVMVLGVAFEAMGLEATVAWAAATLGVTLVIAGVVAGVALIVTHFGTFKRIVGGVWKWFTGAVGTAAGALKGVFESPIKWLINAIKWIVDKVLWLPRELAKLNPFGGNDAATRHTIAKGGANPSVTGRFGPVGAFKAPGLTTSGATGPGRPVPLPSVTSSGATSNSLNTVPHAGHMQTNATGDIVINHTTNLDGRVIAQNTSRHALRAIALS